MGDRAGPTRRQILGSLGCVGAFTAAGRTGSLAALADTEAVAGRVRAGRVDVHVDCDGCARSDDRLRVPFEPLEPGTAGHRVLRVGVPDDANPVDLWVRTDCPGVPDPLGRALEVRVSVESVGEDGDDARTVVRGWESLDDLRRGLHGGVRLAGGTEACLAGGETLALTVEYRLPADAAWAAGTRSDLVVELFARQCRHAAGADGPFAAEPCPELACPDCVVLGKLDVDGDRLDPDATYAFDDLAAPFADDGHDYRLDVLTVTDTVDETERETVCASFRLLRDGVEAEAPPVCSVRVAGGRAADAPPDGVTYDVSPPLTRTPGELCAAHGTDDPDGDGQRPAVSNVTVRVCAGADGEVSGDGAA